MKNQKPIDAQIQSAEKILAALGEKRKELQARIKQLKVQKQSIAEIPLPFDRLSESNVTNNSTQEKKLLFFGPCSVGGKMSIQGVSKASAPAKAVSSRSVGMSGLGLFAKNPKSNAVNVKTGILCRFRTMSLETT